MTDVVPNACAVTSPVPAFTVATPVAELVHEPPGREAVKVEVEPMHMPLAPVITGAGLTEMDRVTWQLPIEYVTTAEPTDNPVTMPVAEPMAITPGAVLQVPPAIASETVIVCVLHTVTGPVIGNGVGNTVTVLVTKQPAAVYVMFAVPDTNPFTSPDPVTVATLVRELAQVPPVVASANGAVVPAHKVPPPVIAAGPGLTLTILVTVQPAPSEYVIVVVRLADMPVTTPVSGLIVATEGKLLVQVPPGTRSVSVTDAPAQTEDGPAIAEGAVVTETALVI